ncbi:MAG: FtsX-like permease family protein [Bacteroidota bacterium]
MFRNYLKVALRQFYKLPVFSAINLIGLVLGLASSLLIVWEEFKTNQPDIQHVSPTNWGWNVQLSYKDVKIEKFNYFVSPGKFTNIFASMAIFVSCLGLFGLAAFTAERRTKEIGIRKVLGASVSSIVSLISKEFAVLVIIAFALAAPLALWQVNNFLLQYEYHINVSWWVFPITGAGALLLAVITVGTQAFRAAKSNPVDSLKTE